MSTQVKIKHTFTEGIRELSLSPSGSSLVALCADEDQSIFMFDTE
jgi:hypothetical protein